ncbi:DUF2922 domain-containing protein [Lactobacillus kalixensis]|uniref:DUF2922 domain-containing protein n=1 Tax=Lactobacillus kalixensis DSM 16043 TaxID=1423763 RepID=A0A0R1U1H5_9LACO|nr:DUF2922 domain-containing protein [Lactobacillus kalixensis]KRL87239.1 hypothetical protein FC46_GL001814 [Lactobacillus kalixensis DSM 16043]
MTETTKTLRLNFTNGENKTSTLSLAGARDNVSEEEVRENMRVIADSGVFEKDGVVMYAKPKSAAYVERGVTTIFDDSATTADKQA